MQRARARLTCVTRLTGLFILDIASILRVSKRASFFAIRRNGVRGQPQPPQVRSRGRPGAGIGRRDSRGRLAAGRGRRGPRWLSAWRTAFMATAVWRASDAGTGLVGLAGLALAVAILLWGGGSGPYAAHNSAPPSAHVSGQVFAPTIGPPGGLNPPDLPCPTHLGVDHCGYGHLCANPHIDAHAYIWECMYVCMCA